MTKRKKNSMQLSNAADAETQQKEQTISQELANKTAIATSAFDPNASHSDKEKTTLSGAQSDDEIKKELTAELNTSIIEFIRAVTIKHQSPAETLEDDATTKTEELLKTIKSIIRENTSLPVDQKGILTLFINQLISRRNKDAVASYCNALKQILDLLNPEIKNIEEIFEGIIELMMGYQRESSFNFMLKFTLLACYAIEQFTDKSLKSAAKEFREKIQAITDSKNAYFLLGNEYTPKEDVTAETDLSTLAFFRGDAYYLPTTKIHSIKLTSRYSAIEYRELFVIEDGHINALNHHQHYQLTFENPADAASQITYQRDEIGPLSYFEKTTTEQNPETQTNGVIYRFYSMHGENAKKDRDLFSKWAGDVSSIATDIEERIAHEIFSRKIQFLSQLTSNVLFNFTLFYLIAEKQKIIKTLEAVDVAFRESIQAVLSELEESTSGERLTLTYYKEQLEEILKFENWFKINENTFNIVLPSNFLETTEEGETVFVGEDYYALPSQNKIQAERERNPEQHYSEYELIRLPAIIFVFKESIDTIIDYMLENEDCIELEDLLDKLLDELIENDFSAYIESHTSHKNQYNWIVDLINTKIIQEIKDTINNLPRKEGEHISLLAGMVFDIRATVSDSLNKLKNKYIEKEDKDPNEKAFFIENLESIAQSFRYWLPTALQERKDRIIERAYPDEKDALPEYGLKIHEETLRRLKESSNKLLETKAKTSIKKQASIPKNKEKIAKEILDEIVRSLMRVFSSPFINLEEEQFKKIKKEVIALSTPLLEVGDQDNPSQGFNDSRNYVKTVEDLGIKQIDRKEMLSFPARITNFYTDNIIYGPTIGDVQYAYKIEKSDRIKNIHQDSAYRIVEYQPFIKKSSENGHVRFEFSVELLSHIIGNGEFENIRIRFHKKEYEFSISLDQIFEQLTEAKTKRQEFITLPCSEKNSRKAVEKPLSKKKTSPKTLNTTKAEPSTGLNVEEQIKLNRKLEAGQLENCLKSLKKKIKNLEKATEQAKNYKKLAKENLQTAEIKDTLSVLETDISTLKTKLEKTDQAKNPELLSLIEKLKAIESKRNILSSRFDKTKQTLKDKLECLWKANVADLSGLINNVMEDLNTPNIKNVARWFDQNSSLLRNEKLTIEDLTRLCKDYLSEMPEAAYLLLKALFKKIKPTPENNENENNRNQKLRNSLLFSLKKVLEENSDISRKKEFALIGDQLAIINRLEAYKTTLNNASKWSSNFNALSGKINELKTDFAKIEDLELKEAVSTLADDYKQKKLTLFVKLRIKIESLSYSSETLFEDIVHIKKCLSLEEESKDHANKEEPFHGIYRPEALTRLEKEIKKDTTSKNQALIEQTKSQLMRKLCHDDPKLFRFTSWINMLAAFSNYKVIIIDSVQDKEKINHALLGLACIINIMSTLANKIIPKPDTNEKETLENMLILINDTSESLQTRSEQHYLFGKNITQFKRSRERLESALEKYKEVAEPSIFVV